MKRNPFMSFAGKAIGAFVFITIAASFFNQALANVPPPQPGGNIPLAGGLAILAAAGVGLGVKKIYDNRKKEK